MIFRGILDVEIPWPFLGKSIIKQDLHHLPRIVLVFLYEAVITEIIG